VNHSFADWSAIDKKYSLIFADPPWKYGDTTSSIGVEKIYPTMKTEDIAKFDVKDKLATPGIFFCWATWPKLDECLALGELLKLTYLGCPIVWIKTKRDGSPMGAKGVRPKIVKPTTEIVLAFGRKANGRPLPLLTEREPQILFAPVIAHSHKPDEAYDRAVRLFGDVPRLEMFARRSRPGWDIFGNEVGVAAEEQKPKIEQAARKHPLFGT